MPMTNGQIVNVVREAAEEAKAQVSAAGHDPMLGTANFDKVVLRLDHPRPTLAKALNAAGIGAEWHPAHYGTTGYALRLDDPVVHSFGFCGVWTEFCDAFAAKLNARGVPASVRYMMD